MDFNLEKQLRKPLTQLLKCLGADLDLLAPVYQVLYTIALRFNLKTPQYFLKKHEETEHWAVHQKQLNRGTGRSDSNSF